METRQDQIKPVTLYRYVGPQGQLREQGESPRHLNRSAATSTPAEHVPQPYRIIRASGAGIRGAPLPRWRSTRPTGSRPLARATPAPTEGRSSAL